MSSIARASPSTSGRPQRNASRNVPTVYRDDWAGDEDDEDDEDEDEEDNDDDEENEDDGSQAVDGAATPDVSEIGGSSSALLPRHRQVAALSGIPSSSSKSKSNRGRPSSKASNPKAFQARSAVEAAPPPTQAESGFMADAPDAAQAQQVYAFILDKLRSHQWKGRNLTDSIEVIPNDPQFRARAQHFLSLGQVSERLQQGYYTGAVVFEKDMLHLFNCFRRGYEIGSPQHGDTMILQRMYQCMTAPHPQVPYTTVASIQRNLARPEASQLYSSVANGPGTAARGADSDLPTRMAVKGKQYCNYTYHKGQLITVGDWVHLMNPADPTRPTISQIWKIFKREGAPDEAAGLTCCWYFRPEQTVHPASRYFFPDEVMKTGLYIDHAIEDVISKCHTLFYTRWTKGRPPRHVLDPLDPLYIAEYRYDERTYEQNKIKNWNSCLPEEQRGPDQPFELFAEPIMLPARIPSPFLRGVQGPGRICDESEVGPPGGKKPLAGAANAKRGPEATDELPDPFGSPSKRKHRRTGPDPSADPEAALVSGWTSSHMPIPTPQQVEAAHHILRTYSTSIPARIGQGEYGRLYHHLGSPQGLSIDLNSVTHHLRGALDVQTLSTWREALQIGVAAQNYGIGARGHASTSRPSAAATAAPPPPASLQRLPTATVERTLAAAVGGYEAYVAPLPEQTVALFASNTPTEEEEQTEGQEGAVRKGVQWFAAPPVDLPRSVRGTGFNGVTHSLDYFYHVALNSGQSGSTGKSDADGREGQDEMSAALTHLAQSWRTLLEQHPSSLQLGGEILRDEQKVKALEEEVSKLIGADWAGDSDEAATMRKVVVRMVAGLQ
ncbi:hypothetical protein BCV69DRAFT_293079 [Microstroma glucosiphilum]|uniref:BAH domain-containing protein n=1 Tax=Pseudomicrostroma glucosiphilum TaxID=1684307 RepID=A0A316UAF2_9BASI|nr:hypothetical protein BCV69DRAFT_293079 [Pseudomicrostroma glucosiphilum]PWN21804.1 hypothetical protein BCV69DRAFT_293079 [Pseudomicrostroma glucosiphilum]